MTLFAVALNSFLLWSMDKPILRFLTAKLLDTKNRLQMQRLISELKCGYPHPGSSKEPTLMHNGCFYSQGSTPPPPFLFWEARVGEIHALAGDIFTHLLPQWCLSITVQLCSLVTVLSVCCIYWRQEKAQWNTQWSHPIVLIKKSFLGLRKMEPLVK